jgi:uncharacterized protein YbjT (DUF2867 family)
MKIVVVGGSGLIGSQVVARLREDGHEVVAASPKSGIDTVTGAGLAEAVAGASVVVDVSNAPNWEASAVLNFFETSTRNLLAAEAKAGVGHHVALSVVGSERLPDSSYFPAKIAQEALIKASPIPYSIVRATQFFEFVAAIADAAAAGDTVRVPPATIQPVASADVARLVASVAEGAPIGGTVELGGPDRFTFEELVGRSLSARGDQRKVVVDPNALYFGDKVDDRTLVPDDDARLGETRFENWLARAASA